MPTLQQRQLQKQKLAPRQVLQARLLQLNTINLEQAIIKELEQNPTLEQLDPEEVEEKTVAEEILDNVDASVEDIYTDESSYYLEQEKRELPIPDRRSFIENMISQIKDYGLSSIEQEIAEDILWNINERGYLDTELILIADNYNLEEEDVLPILSIVQRMEPKGIASRDLEECLKIQLEDAKDSISFLIVNKYFDDFMHKRYEKIQKKIKCSDQNLHDAIHSDLRRARSAPNSIIPTTTGAAKALSSIFPDIELGGCGIRVPVANCSLTDITCVINQNTDINTVNNLFQLASKNMLKNILYYNIDPIVSIDVKSNPYSCVFDSELTYDSLNSFGKSPVPTPINSDSGSMDLIICIAALYASNLIVTEFPSGLPPSK